VEWTGIFVRGYATVRYAHSVNPHRNLGGVAGLGICSETYAEDIN